ncbi:hypothetical protein HYD64_03725 [Mycoplasmopsis bovis]|nr:hypothetical protein [Mycoplasmopsis bovis]QQH60257.1 hypothetical protein HYD64_03725 [Mycoplasmopsis bovis]
MRLKHNQRKIKWWNEPWGRKSNRIDEEPEEEAEKAYREAAIIVLETLEWVHRRTRSTNLDIDWGQNHLEVRMMNKK